jgi:membrane protein DedA with SNARE-associated domain/membrane-associated phospholipid phosphatase
MESIQSAIQSFLPFMSPEYLSAHPDLALWIVFLISFGEALLIIGLFVPSTVILVGAGTMVGTGHLDFWPVFLATAVGAIAGDQVSYWAGRWYGDKLKDMWPLNRHPQLLLRGEDYVRQHGGKSIAIGRFVPGVKAVVPGIVGMLGMSQLFFIAVNFSSGLVWTAAHVFPGILIGQGLAFAGELSERLVIVLLVLLLVLAVCGWLIRLAAASMSPRIDTVLRHLSASARRSKNRTIQRVGRALSPERPSSRVIVLFAFVTLVALVILIDLVSGLILKGAISNLDLTTNNLLSHLRSEPGDRLMVLITLLGDQPVTLTLGALTVLWLLWRKAWRAAISATAAISVAYVATLCFKPLEAASRIPMGIVTNSGDAFVFPSAHALLSGTVFGMIVLLASVGRGRWTRALMISTVACIIIAISFSRLYLGVSWFSDVLGGLVLASIICAAFGIVVETLPTRKLRPLSFLGISTAVLFAMMVGYAAPQVNSRLALYAQPEQTRSVSLEQLNDLANTQLPIRRIALAGRGYDPFSAVWAGDLTKLRTILSTQQWIESAPWSVSSGMKYLDTHATLSDLAPQPLLHKGEAAVLTAVREADHVAGSRLVLRAYNAHINLVQAGYSSPIYLLHLTEEIQRPRLFLFNMPRRIPVSPQMSEDFNGKLAVAAGASAAQQETGTTNAIPVIVAK